MKNKMTSLISASAFALSISLLMYGNPALAQEGAVCEIKVKEDKATGDRFTKSLHIETYNSDSNLDPLWNSLFNQSPGMSIDDLLTLQADQPVTWEAGTLEMSGSMKLKVKTDKKNPGLKEIKIEKMGKKDGTTDFVSGTGGVNPNLADGGWHEVKIKNMDNVTVTFVSDTVTDTVTGFLKELKVKLDRDSTTGNPIVRDFKLKLKAATTIPDVKKGIVYSVSIDVPETVVTALANTEYEEKTKDKPENLMGHTEAEYDRPDDALVEGVDIASLDDGNNDDLKERTGPCVVAPAPAPVEDEDLSSLYSCVSSPSFSGVFNGFDFQVVNTAGFLATVETRGPFRVTLSAQCSDGGTANEVYDFASTLPPGVSFTTGQTEVNAPCTLGNSNGFGACRMRVPFKYDLFDGGGLIPFCDPDSFFLEATVTLTPLPAPTGIPQLVGSLQCNFGPSGDG